MLNSAIIVRLEGTKGDKGCAPWRPEGPGEGRAGPTRAEGGPPRDRRGDGPPARPPVRGPRVREAGHAPPPPTGIPGGGVLTGGDGRADRGDRPAGGGEFRCRARDACGGPDLRKGPDRTPGQVRRLRRDRADDRGRRDPEGAEGARPRDHGRHLRRTRRGGGGDDRGGDGRAGRVADGRRDRGRPSSPVPPPDPRARARARRRPGGGRRASERREWARGPSRGRGPAERRVRG